MPEQPVKLRASQTTVMRAMVKECIDDVAQAQQARSLQPLSGGSAAGEAGGSVDPGSGGSAAADWRIDQAGGTGSVSYGALSGAINGSNAVFTVSAGYYVSGTLKAYRNGVLLAQGSGANEWAETDPAAGTITLGTAPKTGNFLLVEYGV